jgi:hypothetical protein
MNPGIEPNGLFWTAALPPGSVKVDFNHGRAELRAHEARIRDFFTFTNSLFGGPSEPATVSFEVHWGGNAPHDVVVDPVAQLRGEFIRNSAQMEWSATVGDYTFESKRASTSSSAFAEIGREQNGVFF